MGKRKTHEEFIKEIFDLVGDEYKVLEEYNGSTNKITFLHKECNKTFKMRPHDFLRGQRCSICNGNKRKTLKEFKQEVFNEVKDEYEVLSDNYINNKTPIKFLHKKCNKIFYMSSVCFFTQKQRCPYCSKSHKLSTEEFKQKVFDLVGNEYKVLSDYNGTSDKVLILHERCKNTYMVKPNHFLNTGTRCPYCKESKGEKRIENWLKLNNIKYERNFSFNNLYYKTKSKPLSFDFKILLNEKLILLEYDGEFHYKNIFKSNEYKNQKIRDKMKDTYCKENNIKLIRIPYTQFNNIENILNESLL